MNRFLVIGPSGYIAKRHLRAINDLGGSIIAYLDLEESEFLGKKDSTIFLQNENQMKSYLSKNKNEVDYLVVCSPNYLHYNHIKIGLSSGVNVICEKPIVLKSQELDDLEELEAIYSVKAFTIYQLRLHEINKKVKELINDDLKTSQLTYIARRDQDYFKSWKMDPKLSGGILFNLGIHYFDFLISHFGDPEFFLVDDLSLRRSKGKIQFKKLSCDWLFSLDERDLVDEREFIRNFTIEGTEIDFSGGFEDLHIKSYKQIFDGFGFGLSIAKKSIKLVEQMSLKK